MIFICRHRGFFDEPLLLRLLPWYCGLHQQHARGHCMLAVRMCTALEAMAVQGAQEAMAVQGSSGGHGRSSSGPWHRSPRPGPYSRNPYYPPPPKFPWGSQGVSGALRGRTDRTVHDRTGKPSGARQPTGTRSPSGLARKLRLLMGMTRHQGPSQGSLSYRFHIHDREAGGWNGLCGHNKRSRLPQTSLRGQDRQDD